MMREFWRELLTPSAATERLYLWALIALGHAHLGAAAAEILAWAGVTGFVPLVAVLLVYVVVKEMGDLRIGGGLIDGTVDTAFVGLGLFHVALPVFHSLVLLLVCLGLLVKAKCTRSR